MADTRKKRDIIIYLILDFSRTAIPARKTSGVLLPARQTFRLQMDE
jgi:hypothetical protein